MPKVLAVATQASKRAGEAEPEVFDSGVFEVWPGYFVCQDSREGFVGQALIARVSMYSTYSCII